MLATGDVQKTTIYDVKTKAKIHEFKHDGRISVAFSNDGSMLATGDDANKQRYRCQNKSKDT